MRSRTAGARTPINLALALIRTAKLWTVTAIQDTCHPPLIAGFIPTRSQEISKEIELCIQKLNEQLSNNDAQQAPLYFKQIKHYFSHPDSALQQQIQFLIEYYEHLDQLSSAFQQSMPRDPLSVITSTFMKHCNQPQYQQVVYSMHLKPAKLKVALQETQATGCNKPVDNLTPAKQPDLSLSFSTHAIQSSLTDSREKSIPLPLSQPTNLPSTPKENTAPEFESLYPQIFSAPLAPEAPMDRGTRSPLAINAPISKDEKTLAQYQEACLDYLKHLSAALMKELADCHRHNSKHPLFRHLKITPAMSQSPAQMTQQLLDCYYPSQTPSVISQTQALEQQRQHLDQAIATTPPLFQVAWEKYKLIKKLLATKSKDRFHELLQEPENKATLTKQRDSALVKFIKACGLVVATILVLPLFIYLGHRSLYGSRATHGHLFLNRINQIDKLASEKNKPTPSRRCCFR